MTVAELIKRLQEFEPDLEIAIRDGFNGGGTPRTINLGPTLFNPLDYHQHFANCKFYQTKGQAECTCKRNEALDYSDLKSSDCETTIHMGYGCY